MEVFTVHFARTSGTANVLCPHVNSLSVTIDFDSAPIPSVHYKSSPYPVQNRLTSRHAIYYCALVQHYFLEHHNGPICYRKRRHLPLPQAILETNVGN